MRILANENFPGEAIEALRSRGHDVAWVRTDAPGSSDEEVIARATREGRLLITFDKDFGALAFRSGLSAHPQGSFSSAFRRVLHRALAETAVALLEGRTDWPGHFSVVGDDRLRMTRLPIS